MLLWHDYNHPLLIIAQLRAMEIKMHELLEILLDSNPQSW
jgi:hypothetical protein